MQGTLLSFLSILCVLSLVQSFRTGLEDGLICNVCVGTHPGCGENDFDYRWYWGKLCPRHNDKCVKLIERKGAETLVTRVSAPFLSISLTHLSLCLGQSLPQYHL